MNVLLNLSKMYPSVLPSLLNALFLSIALTSFKDKFRLSLSMISMFLLNILSRLKYLAIDNVNLVMELEAKAVERDMINFKPPPLDVLTSLILPYKNILRPMFLTLENIPKEKRPLIFVSNHSLLAFEYPIFLEGLYRYGKIFPRTLVDHAHLQIPITGALLTTLLGCVDGTPRNVDLLLSQGNL